MDVVIITPEPGRHAEIGQQLLTVIAAMGLPANTLQWVTWPAAGFAVPMEVFNVFETPPEEIAGDPTFAEAPGPKKRGRAKKAVTSTDEPEKEE